MKDDQWRSILTVVVSALGISAIGACSQPTPPHPPTPTATEPSRITPLPPPTATSAVPTADGDTLVRTQCGSCHPLERFLSLRKTREGWQQSMDRMVRLSTPDTLALLDYLSKTYGP